MKKNTLLLHISMATVIVIFLVNNGCNPTDENRTTAINCNTTEGMLAMMATPAADNHTFTNSEATVTTKIFRTACPSCGNTENNCWNKITMHVFHSSDRSKLESLPGYAQNNSSELYNSVLNSHRSFSPAGNVSNVKTITLNHNRVISQSYSSSTVFYRFGKEIDDPNGINPFVWSDIFTFNNTSPQPPPTSSCTKPDLKPAPADEDDITVFDELSGSLSDSTGNTYIRTARIWCNGLFDGSGQMLSGNSGGNDQYLGEIKQLTFQLPPITWGVREINNVAVTSAFNCGLFHSGESNALATINVPSLAAGATFTAPPFTARETRTVYMFPATQGFDACFVKTWDHVQGTLDITEKNFVVKVDIDDSVAECNDNVNDNQRTYNNRGSR